VNLNQAYIKEPNSRVSPVEVTPRESLLAKAIQITTQDRNKEYSGPEDSFKAIAAFWSTYLTTSKGSAIMLSASDVAHMMILMKVARLAANPTHFDSLLDIAGYAACGADCINVKK
jgi:hypothetical protein